MSKSKVINLNRNSNYTDLDEEVDVVTTAFQTIKFQPEQILLTQETVDASKEILSALDLRHRYVPFEPRSPFSDRPTSYSQNSGDPKNPPKIPSTNEIFLMKDGVTRVYAQAKDVEQENPLFPSIAIASFYQDIKTLVELAADGPAKSLSFKRMELLESKYLLHAQVNHDAEFSEQQKVRHRDFYNVRKVDNHVHLSFCMNQKHLLRYIKSKVKKEPTTLVKVKNDVPITLEQVFQELNLTPYDLSIDHLNMHADANTFHRFDRFDTKYNPCGDSSLRDIFLATDNYLGGRYLAEVCQQVFEDLEESKYQMAEYRVSIYGRNRNEWKNLADWVVNNKLFSSNVRWMIQIPRIYPVFKRNNSVKNFQEFLDNIFLPLFEATKDPQSHPNIHAFLQHLVAFDSVDDESKPEYKLFNKFPRPVDWDNEKNPPYTYYIYYMWANIHALNNYRKMKGMNMFALRPHCGESGDVDHLAAGFLVSQSIAHGIQLRKHPVFQYLFYLTQIGISMSPLSNNKLFLRYEKNPFPKFFARGLNVTLSTDDPLQIHLTRDPLVEEYSIAAQVYRLSPTDLCEIALNSVFQSGFENDVKAQWAGENWFRPFSQGDDITKTNVPTIRKTFREQAMRQEYSFLENAGKFGII